MIDTQVHRYAIVGRFAVRLIASLFLSLAAGGQRPKFVSDDPLQRHRRG